jgi:hypothetical protein
VKKQYKVTFTYRGYVAGVLYHTGDTKEDAIESAKLFMSNKWTKVRAVLVDDEDGE